MILGVDFSQHGGALAASTIDCWKSQGVRHAIVQYSDRMVQHLLALHTAGGIEIEGYVYLYWELSPWGQTPADRTRSALAFAKQGGGIRRLWLDAEDTLKPFQPGQLAECVRICDEAGMPCGIYTGRWWWTSHGQNNTDFSYLPLWDAAYLSEAPVPDLSRMPQDVNLGFRPYGGWSTRDIWQWHNTTALCGHSVDLNVLESLVPEPGPGPEPIEEDGMIRVNGIHKDFDGRFIDEAGAVCNDVRGDFGLPANATRVRLEVFLNYGRVRIHDGDAGMYAGQIGWAGDRYGTVDVQIDNNCATFYGGKEVEFNRLGIVGYWT